MKIKRIFVIIFVIIVCVPWAGVPSEGDMRFGLSISMPYVNSFLTVPENEKAKTNTGFLGIAIGLDYYHSDNQFVNLGVSGAIDFPFPIPMATDPPFESGEEETQLSSVYFTLSNNHRIKILTIGYGLSYAINFWNYTYYGEIEMEIGSSHGAFGLVFPLYALYDNRVGIGIVYRPTFFRPNLTEKLKYEHLISIEFIGKAKFL